MIRLTAIELENFKNVAKGRISLSSAAGSPEEWGPSIVGIYGQNGSGKTSVITALCILKSVWATGELPEGCADCIAVGSDRLSVSVDAIACAERPGRPAYSFTYTVEVARGDSRPAIAGERLAYRALGEGKPSLRRAFDYSADAAGTSLGPKTAWTSLCALDRGLDLEMAVAQRLAALEGRSLLMSSEFGAVLDSIDAALSYKMDSGTASKSAQKACGDALEPASRLRGELRAFAVGSLSIVTQSRQAEPMLNMLRISTHEGSGADSADAFFGIDLSAPSLLSAEHLPALQATIATVSTVLGALVPGLELGVESLGGMMADDGTAGERVEITATRGGVTVPLRAESEGVKKLASILVLLVDVYSKPGACVAIDELDSGIFEFLLGELLQVLQDHGRGQLIFTAHNLRPLETLDKTSLVFTTTNPGNRYVTFKGSKSTNNLRSQYLRAVNLGGQPETIYEATSRYEIDSAFYDAGNPEG